MARFLAIDWDPPKLRVLGAQISKGKARVEQSLSLPLAEELTVKTAPALGKALKDALGQAGIAPAPVLFSLGRDRVIIKEMSIPFVPTYEEPTVVRFQAAKEMTDAATDVTLDYSLLASPKAGQQTPVQVVMVRKAIVSALKALCEAAGLKMHGIVPRPFALAGLLDRNAPSTIPLARGLLVPTGTEEAEFCVYSADRLVWARTLSVDPGLAGEVQKNLMLLAVQKPDLPEVQKIETAGIAGLGNLRVPKEPLESWRDKDVKPQDPVAFLGALGLAELAAKSATLPVNLAAPKEPKPVVDNSKRRRKLGLIAAVILVPVLLAGWYLNLSNMENKIKELQLAKEDLEDFTKKTENEQIDVAGLKEWQNTTISWLDEFFDIAARFPQEEGLRITSAKATLLNKQALKGSGPFAGRIQIHGSMKKASQGDKVDQFASAMRSDKQFIKVHSTTLKTDSFDLIIDVAPRDPSKYTAELVAVPKTKRVVETTPEIEADAAEQGADNE